MPRLTTLAAALAFLSAVPAFAEGPASVEEIRTRARSAYEAGQWAQALAAYQELLWESADDADVREATARMKEIDGRL